MKRSIKITLTIDGELDPDKQRELKDMFKKDRGTPFEEFVKTLPAEGRQVFIESLGLEGNQIQVTALC